MTSFTRLISIVLLAFWIIMAAASFDCNKATTETEKAISLTLLSALDTIMGNVYKYARQISKNFNEQYSKIKKEQIKWLILAILRQILNVYQIQAPNK